MIQLPLRHSRATACVLKTIDNLISHFVTVCLTSTLNEDANFALLYRNRIFRTLPYRKWLAQRFMGHRVLSWWTENPHSFYSCLCCDVCWGRCVSNWEWSKPSDAVARVKRERLIPIVPPSMHHKCDEKFLIPCVGCILSTTRGALHAGL
jgi:hypothetical protein